MVECHEALEHVHNVQATKPKTERQGVMAERYMEDKTISLKCSKMPLHLPSSKGGSDCRGIDKT